MARTKTWLAAAAVAAVLGALLLKVCKTPEPGAADALCAMQRCLLPLARCALAPSCRQLAGCMKDCGEPPEPDCTERCIMTHPSSEAFDALSGCMLAAGCLAAGAPPTTQPPFPAPTATTHNFRLSHLYEGWWYVVRGLDKGVDCVPGACQAMHFRPDPYRDQAAACEHVLRFPEHEKVLRTTITEGARRGVLRAEYTLAGVDGADEWRILHHNRFDGVIVLDYTGANAVAAYRGLYVLARDARVLSRSGRVRRNVARALEESGAGVTMEDLCTLPAERADCARLAAG